MGWILKECKIYLVGFYCVTQTASFRLDVLDRKLRRCHKWGYHVGSLLFKLWNTIKSKIFSESKVRWIKGTIHYVGFCWKVIKIWQIPPIFGNSHFCFLLQKNLHILFGLEKPHKNLKFVVFFYMYLLISIHQLNYKTETVEKEILDNERYNRYMNCLR